MNKEENMTEMSTDYFTPTTLYRVGRDAFEAAVVEQEGRGRAPPAPRRA